MIRQQEELQSVKRIRVYGNQGIFYCMLTNLEVPAMLRCIWEMEC